MDRFFKSRTEQRKGENLTLFFAVFILVVVRFLYFGFQYFPQLDDYIQHHNYAPQGSFFYLVKLLGLLAARPLAGMLDITLWSWLFPCAIVGVILLSAMYALSALEFYGIFKKFFGTSHFFIVIFGLLPLGIEGTYWMSASTRIIPGLLFAALSAKLLLKYLEEGKVRFAVLACVLQFLTFCFYEQSATLSCALNVLIGLLYIRKSEKRWLASFSCFASALLYFLLTSSVDSIVYSGRTNIILPITPYYFDTFLPDLLSQLKSAFLGGGYYTFVYGFIRGVMRVLKDGAWLYCLMVLLAAIFFGYVAAKGKSEKKGKLLLPLGVGLLLFLAPLAPFFIIGNPWFSFRGTVTCFVGIALVIDVLIRLIMGKGRYGIAIFSAFVAFVFCICSVSEIADYRATHEADMRVVSTISTVAEELEQSDFPKNGKVAVFNVDARYVSELNSYYHEHIHGVTESSWALTGAVRCYTDNVFSNITYVPYSFKNDHIYKQWNYAEYTISSMDAVYLYDYEENTIEKLDVQYLGDGSFDLFFANGEKYGTVVEENNVGDFFEE